MEKASVVTRSETRSSAAPKEAAVDFEAKVLQALNAPTKKSDEAPVVVRMATQEERDRWSAEERARKFRYSGADVDVRTEQEEIMFRGLVPARPAVMSKQPSPFTPEKEATFEFVSWAPGAGGRKRYH